MLLFYTVSACRKTSPEEEREDPVVYAVRKMVKTPVWPNDARRRADLAISKWQNGLVDPEPIVVNACLTRFEGYDEIDFAIMIFDEDRDVVGVGISERPVEASARNDRIEETYPVYFHTPFVDVADLHMVPFRVRTADKRKDEQLWQKYLESNYEELLQKHGSWEATVPPVWLSIPEPNKVDVWVYVYDKAGNKSEPVKLLDFTKRNTEAQTTIR
jgi:hypothetical protein